MIEPPARALHVAMAALSLDMSWALAAQVLNLVAMLLTLKLWTAYLAPAELGLMGLLIGAASIIVGVAIGPLSQPILVSYAYYDAKGRGREYRAVTGGMVARRSGATAVFILVAGTPIALQLGLHWAMPLAVAGLFAVDAWRSFEEALLAGARRQREVATIAVADVWLRLAGVWGFLHFLGGNAYAAIAGNLLGALVFFACIRLSLRLEAFPSNALMPDSERHAMRDEISRLARPLLPSMILSNLTEMANRYIIGGTIGLQAAGLFVVSYGLVKRPFGMLNHVTSLTMTPILSQAVAAGNAAGIRRTRLLWLAIALAGALAGILLFYLFRDFIVLVLLSPQYAAASELIFGLSIAVAVFNVGNVFTWFLMTGKDTRSVLISNIVGCVATLVLTVVLCPFMDVGGAVWALAVGYLLQLGTSLWMFRKLGRGQ